MPDAFEYLFKSFTEENVNHTNLYHGYKLIACDGSDLCIANNPNDAETSWKCNQFVETANYLHLNAFYDVLNRVYLDAVIQTASEYHEYRACIRMMERSHLTNAILIADRGYENYNIIAHAIQNNWKFVIRVKDIHSNGIASILDLPKRDVFDTDVSITFTRKNTKSNKAAGYRWMPQNQMFDFLPPRSEGTYTLSFRIARFPIGEDKYEVVVTNLDRYQISIENLKEIYGMRWGIETSFREIKYAIGLTCFHARKADYIKQEIYARLLLYNYCELITTHVMRRMADKNKTKQVNFTIAIYICREYLRQKRDISPPDVIKLIEKYTLPIRPNRKDPRKVKTQSAVSFLYRVA